MLCCCSEIRLQIAAGFTDGAATDTADDACAAWTGQKLTARGAATMQHRNAAQ